MYQWNNNSITYKHIVKSKNIMNIKHIPSYIRLWENILYHIKYLGYSKFLSG